MGALRKCVWVICSPLNPGLKVHAELGIDDKDIEVVVQQYGEDVCPHAIDWVFRPTEPRDPI